MAANIKSKLIWSSRQRRIQKGELKRKQDQVSYAIEKSLIIQEKQLEQLVKKSTKFRQIKFFITNDYICRYLLIAATIIVVIIDSIQVASAQVTLSSPNGHHSSSSSSFIDGVSNLLLDNTISLPTDGERLIEKLKPFHSLEPDAYLDPPEFIHSRGFIAETHHCITKDNYILTLHRVVNPLIPRELRHLLKPVLLQHGLLTSSFNFLFAADRNRDRPRFRPSDLTRTTPLHVYVPEAPFSWQRTLETLNDLTLAKLGINESSDRLQAPELSDSLALEMANQGYDVWMANSRGSTYSLNHTSFDYRFDWRYWDFSFHEIGLYDLPAQINYILKLRQRKSLSYVGHSQGNLAMFILQSLHPQWASKVKPFIAIAPIAFIPNVYYGAIQLLVKSLGSIGITPTRLNRVLKGQIAPKSDKTERALDLVCVPKWTTPICDLALTLLVGSNFKRANHTRTPIVAHHITEGTSILNVLHFGQMIGSGEFRSFDFGHRENLRRYGSSVNPYYPIGNIRSPDIALIVGRTDPLSTMKNVRITRSMLKVPLLDDYVVPDPVWGHADFFWATGAGRQANAHVIGLVDRYRLVDV